MYGPAVRSKKISASWRRAVLHQCIRPLIGACCAPGHHGYQRACDLVSGQASTGPFGPPVFVRAGKTEPPSRFILSQTSAGKRTKLSHHVLLLMSYSSFVRAGAVPSSRPAYRRSRRAQGRSRPAVALTWGLALPLPGRALTLVPQSTIVRLGWTVTEMCRQLRLISSPFCGHRRRCQRGCGLW